MAEPTEVQNLPSATLLAGLAQLLAASGPFHTVNLHLYKSPTPLTPSTVLADFVEADFAGYADVAGVAFSAPYLDVDNTALVIGADHAFIATGPSPANTVYGYFLSDTTNAVYIAGYSFATPFGISATGQAVTVVPFIRYSGN